MAEAGVKQRNPIDPYPVTWPAPAAATTEGAFVYRLRPPSALGTTDTFMLDGCSSLSRRELRTVTGAAIRTVTCAAVRGPAATIGSAFIGGVVGHEGGKT